MTPKESVSSTEVCEAAMKFEAAEMTSDGPSTSFEKRTIGPVPAIPWPARSEQQHAVTLVRKKGLPQLDRA